MLLGIRLLGTTCLVRIVKPPGCRRTDALGGKNIAELRPLSGALPLSLRYGCLMVPVFVKRNIPPDKKTLGSISLKSKKTGGGEQFLLLFSRAEALAKGVCLFTDTVIILSICLYIYLSIYLSIYLYIYIYIYICIYVYIYIYIYIYIDLSIYLSICLSVCLSVYLSIYLSIYLYYGGPGRLSRLRRTRRRCPGGTPIYIYIYIYTDIYIYMYVYV